MLGVFSFQIRVIIGKSDINVCVLINQRFTCVTLNEWVEISCLQILCVI